MAYIGRNKEKLSYSRQPKRYYQGYYPKEPSMAYLFQQKLSELVFEIHEFKNLGFDNSKKIEIERELRLVMDRSRNIWYMDVPSISRDIKAKSEYIVHYKTSLNDEVWIFYQTNDSVIYYWIE